MIKTCFKNFLKMMIVKKVEQKCKDILYYHSDIPVGQVISGTEGANQFYSKIVTKLFINGSKLKANSESSSFLCPNFIKRLSV